MLDYIILGLYAIGMIAIALYTRNRSKSVNDFLFAGKKGLNGWMSAFSYGTTYFSAVIFIGYAGQFGAKFQLAAVWIGIGNAIFGALVAWKLLAKRTKNMTQRLSAKTMPDFFEKRYESPRLKTVSAIIIFLFLIPYSASVYNGLSSMFEIVFGIPGWIVMICLAVLTALYLFFGGYFATSLSDFIQGIIMLVGVILMVVFFLRSEQVAFDLSNLNWFTPGFEGGIFGSTVSLISLIILTSLGVYGLPQTVHKYYAIRDKKAINQGMIISTIFALIIGFGAYFVGGLSSKFFTPESVGGYDYLIPNMLKIVIPAGLMGLIVVLLLSASMSTLASVSLSSASVMAIDIYKNKINKKANDKKVSWTMRISCLVFVAISLILAILNTFFNISAIAYLMGISWGTLSGCFIGPFVGGLISKKTTKAAAWVSMIGSLVITIVLIFVLGYAKLSVGNLPVSFGSLLQQGLTMSPFIGVICMVYSILSTIIVSIFTKKPSQEAIKNAFEKQIENVIE